MKDAGQARTCNRYFYNSNCVQDLHRNSILYIPPLLCLIGSHSNENRNSSIESMTWSTNKSNRVSPITGKIVHTSNVTESHLRRERDLRQVFQLHFRGQAGSNWHKCFLSYFPSCFFSLVSICFLESLRDLLLEQTMIDSSGDLPLFCCLLCLPDFLSDYSMILLISLIMNLNSKYLCNGVGVGVSRTPKWAFLLGAAATWGPNTPGDGVTNSLLALLCEFSLCKNGFCNGKQTSVQHQNSN